MITDLASNNSTAKVAMKLQESQDYKRLLNGNLSALKATFQLLSHKISAVRTPLSGGGTYGTFTVLIIKSLTSYL